MALCSAMTDTEDAVPSPWVVRHVRRLAPGGRVLDVAAGTGRHACFLAACGFRVTAVDRDLSALPVNATEIARVEADLESDGWPELGPPFDGLIVVNYLHRPTWHRLIGCLAPGGLLIYETFARGHERFGRPRNPDFLLEEGELLRRTAETFAVIDYWHGLREGPSPALKQMICARKW
jgi:SAM-dependent methyltransferase